MTTLKTSILLVDDQPQRLLTYVAILDQLDLDIVEARSGEAALRALDDTDFAAILLDVNMPGMNGFETAAGVREHPRGYQTPIIFVTGVHVSDLDRIRGYEMGAADYVFVPVVPEILRAKIRVLVQLYEQRLEVTRLNERLLAAYEELGRAHKQLKAENMRELKKLNRSLALTNSNLQSEIGEKEEAERKLREAARRKDEFISILAHELRNPLSAIQSGIELMQLPSLAESRVQWARTLVQRQVEHLVRLVDDLLDVSRVTNGRVQLKRQVVDLRQVIHDSIDSIRSQIEERGHSLAIDLPDEALLVNGDPVRLGQVFGNLLSNAAKYMDQGGRISVGASANPDTAVVHVEDEGAGLQADMLEHVFELFAQAEPAGGRAQSGLGIGLGLVRRLVELHEGRVRAESEGPGKGSRFIVELPLTAALPASVAPGHRTGSASALRLLVIDDNADAAVGLSQVLEQLTSHEIRVAHNGVAGVEAAVAFEPDVVFLDIGLPDIDGYEVARRLRERSELNGTRLIAITGYGPEPARANGALGDFDRFLTKPITFTHLERILAEIAAQADDDRARADAADRSPQPRLAW